MGNFKSYPLSGKAKLRSARFGSARFNFVRFDLAPLGGCLIAATLAAGLAVGCGKKTHDEAAEAPPQATVEHAAEANVVQVDRAEKYPLIAASSQQATSTLNVTGTVNPDISRTIPVVSFASGRVLDVHARIGDYVKKGQLLMDVQSTDVSGAFGNYLKASNDERLAKTQLERATILYDKGAIPKSQLEIAQANEDDAKALLTAAEEQLKVLGVDKSHPSPVVRIYSPVSGYVIAQNVTAAGAAGVTYAGSSIAFTIADLSHVWIICDVYENDLPAVHVGQSADIRMNAYPDQVFTGTISDIGAVLDPVIRTGKVRIQVNNPKTMLRVGMFATATFHGKQLQTRAVVPATSVLHLNDRDWVYVPQDGGKFRRLPVQAGDILPGGQQQIKSGISVGQQVVVNALALQNTADQQ